MEVTLNFNSCHKVVKVAAAWPRSHENMIKNLSDRVIVICLRCNETHFYGIRMRDY